MAEEWSITGNYFEACNCEAACPCTFLGPPTTGECTVLVAWHIGKGRYGGTPLDGLNVALAVHSPGEMTKVKWAAALYVDQKATETQGNALTTIFAGQAGGHFAALGSFIGKVLGVSRASIDIQVGERRRQLQIPGVARMDIEAIPGHGGAEVKVQNLPLAVVPDEPAIVARSKILEYHDHGLKWQISGRNGFYSTFKYRGP